MIFSPSCVLLRYILKEPSCVISAQSKTILDWQNFDWKKFSQLKFFLCCGKKQYRCWKVVPARRILKQMQELTCILFLVVLHFKLNRILTLQMNTPRRNKKKTANFNIIFPGSLVSVPRLHAWCRHQAKNLTNSVFGAFSHKISSAFPNDNILVFTYIHFTYKCWRVLFVFLALK